MDEVLASKIDAFFNKFKHQMYKKGEILIRADDNPSGIFYLKSGGVKEYCISKKGEEIVLNIFKPVSFFPISWAINNTPNIYYFEAVTDAEIWRAPQKEAVFFLKSNPDVLFNLLSRVYKGTDGIFMRLSMLMSGDAYSRLVTELIIYAKRFGKKLGERLYEIKVAEKDLATQTGMSRETISREIKILRDEGFITFGKNIMIIKDLNLLEEQLL